MRRWSQAPGSCPAGLEDVRRGVCRGGRIATDTQRGVGQDHEDFGRGRRVSVDVATAKGILHEEWRDLHEVEARQGRLVG